MADRRETELQRLLEAALAAVGYRRGWHAYLTDLRRRPLSLAQVCCEVYREVGLRLDPATVRRWLA